MKKITLVISSVVLALGIGVAVAQNVNGFQQDVQFYSNVPAGFDNQAPNTVQGVKRNAFDDQMVTLVGRLTKYLGDDHYEFVDQTGSIEVELDDDMNWSHISKGQLIRIYGEVDKDLLSTTIDVEYAVPVEQAPAPASQPK